ncbi:MAG TPA: 3-deoxy-D-manno-octulosonic acid transferase [Alphaproteobacteria bacterium]|nr:3-deoxy-D-manno-octulosonic acid transferase [Alphaproteobacteria bacterium]
MLTRLYRGLTVIGGPAIRFYLARRRAAGKEDPARAAEREGVGARPRPEGPLLWCHAASVGEAVSALVLIERLLEMSPRAHALVTTGTVSSAAVMARRLPPRAFHHYVPVDRPAYVARFFDHWRPDLALWMESELWPNLVGELARRGVPAALVNARMSARSFARWRRLPSLVRPMLGAFRLCLAQSAESAERLAALGAAGVSVSGNIKYSAAPLPADPAALDALRAGIGGRPLWLAASTHDGEDEAFLAAHRHLAAGHPDILTVIVPRHPARGGAVAAAARAAGLTVARRSGGEGPDAAVYVADTIGELGLFYRLAPVVFIGGTLVPHGGQNPIEPAQFGAALIAGPHMENFAAIAETLGAAGGLQRIGDPAALGPAVAALLGDPPRRAALGAAARAEAERQAGVVDGVVESLRPLLAGAGFLP